jgi:tetratricopeptide (TPR) repeat protein
MSNPTTSPAGASSGDSGGGAPELAKKPPGITPEFIAAGLFLLALLPFLPALHNGFIWDDDHHVTGNPVLRSMEGLFRIWFVPGATPQYYPVVFTVFWVEFRLFGLHAPGYHTLNLFLHGINVLLLWRVLLRIGLPERVAVLAAVLWGVHPVQVETVDWIMELKNVLSTTLYLLSGRLLLRLWDFPLPADRPVVRRGWTYAGAVGLFVLALLTKSVTASLPAAFLLILWWRRGTIGWKDVRPLLPFFAIGIVSGLVTAVVEQKLVGANGQEWALTPLQRVLIAGRASAFYAGKLAWPLHLTFFYPRWVVDPAVWWQWLFPAGVLGVALLLVLLRGRIGRGPAAAVLFFIGTLFPALGFINVYPFRYSFVADHFQYVACAGLLTLLAAGLARVPWRAGIAIATVLVVGFGARSYARCLAYYNAFTLYSDVVAQDPNSWVGHALLAAEYAERDQVNNPARPEVHEAIKHFAAATQLAPHVSENFEGLAQMDMKLERFPEAIERLKALLARNDLSKNRRAALLADLGLIETLNDRQDSAMDYYRQAIEMDPAASYTAHYNLGRILAMKNRIDEAVAQFQAALKLLPESADANLALGLCLAQQNRLEEALPCFERAVLYDPSSASARASLERARALLNRQRIAPR